MIEANKKNKLIIVIVIITFLLIAGSIIIYNLYNSNNNEKDNITKFQDNNKNNIYNLQENYTIDNSEIELKDKNKVENQVSEVTKETNNNTNNIEEVKEEFENSKSSYKDTEFSLKFIKIFNKKENMIYSPLSIKYAMKMLNEGADGNTKKQIESLIGDTNLARYNNINNVLSITNGVFIRDTYSEKIKNEYKNILNDKYGAEIKYDTFENAYNINKWIEDKTFGRIKNILKDENVKDPTSTMFLVNALAMDMEWKSSFSEDETHGSTFYLDNGNTMNATMMHKEAYRGVSYFKDNEITAIAMDLNEYEGQQLDFIAIMPNKNLSNFIKNFSTKDFDNITNNLIDASKVKNGLEISIPKFSSEYEFKLKELSNKLGITDLFESNLANFSKMSNETPFCVGDIFHKANIDFTEKGIKAAAVTIVEMVESAALKEENPLEIIINKPFIYLIRDKKTNEIWFVGTVYTPNSWENDKAEYKHK